MIERRTQAMIGIKVLLIIFTLFVNLECFYISKQPVPTLFLNQQFRYNITHNAGQNVKFKLISGPNFITFKDNGQLTFLPNTEGSFELIIQCINSTTNTNLITLSYILNVLNKSKQLQKSLWLFDQSEYFNQGTEKTLYIITDSFDFQTSIMTNENIRLKLIAKNQIGTVNWFYQNLTQTMTASKSSGVVSGYVQNQGTYMIKATAVDSLFKFAQIFIFLKFAQPSLSLQHESYSSNNWKISFAMQQRQQNANLLQNQAKTLITKKDQLKFKRTEKLSNYKTLSDSRQQAKSNQDSLNQKIKSKNEELSIQNNQQSKIQADLTIQKLRVDESKRILSNKQREYSAKLQQSQNINSSRQSMFNQLKSIKSEFQQIKNNISSLQTQIYQQQNSLRDIQYEKSRNNVTYVTLQAQEVRTRQILQIRKNIEFQYLIKKAQTDNKVRRNEDYVFLAQTNYDFAYAEYKKQSLLYLEYSIQSSYLQSQIQLALKEYDQMNKTINKLKLNYVIAEGSVNTLKVAKQQLTKLSTYALNSAVSNATQVKNLTETQMIQEQAKSQIKEYPFAGCKIIGNYAWAGSGKIKMVGKNSLILGSEETVNFGKCTSIKTQIASTGQLSSGQWIQFSGYYWDGAIQATSITILSMN